MYDLVFVRCMPEGPEVVYLANRLLSQHIADKQLNSVVFLKGRYVKHGVPEGFSKFKQALPLRLNTITKHGKVIYFHFEDGWTMVSHLGLMGWWYLGNDSPTWRKEYRNVSFNFNDGSVLTYSDQLSYGTIQFVHNIENADLIANEALDFLEKSTNWKALSQRLELKKNLLATRTIEEALVDQHLIFAGIGNYLKAEVLYAARINPSRAALSLTHTEWKRILHQGKVVGRRILKALHKEDSDAAYEAAMQVYMKKKDPHGNDVETYKNKQGRTTYWVPALQD